MSYVKDRILAKLDELPEPALQEVLDFVEFLSQKEQSGEEPLLRIAGMLGGEPLSAEETERELYGDEESRA